MSSTQLAAKVAAPYAFALLSLSDDTQFCYQVMEELQELINFLNENTELTDYLKSPIVGQKAKKEILTKTLQSQVDPKIFKFLMIIVNRRRINFLQAILTKSLELFRKSAGIKTIKVLSASNFNKNHIDNLTSKLIKLSADLNTVNLEITVDPSLIGGFLIKTESKVIDFSIKNKLENLAKHLDVVLEI